MIRSLTSAIVGVGLLGSSLGSNVRSLYSSTERSFNTSAVHKKDDPNGHQKDDFGRSLSIQAGVAIVGSPEDDDNAVAFDSGRVFVYVEDTDIKNWVLVREIEDGEPGDYFGWAVALHTDLFAVVGACRDDEYGDFSGGAYYFQVETNPDAEQDYPTRIVQSERHGGAFFGYSVAITEASSGDVIVAIGAYGHRNYGAVFTYTRQIDGSLGNEVIIYASDKVYKDRFGWSVSTNGDILITGAPMDDNKGSAHIFKRESDGSYNAVSKLQQTFGDDDANNPLLDDFFGMSVVACDGYVLIGAPHNDVRYNDAGAVFVYQATTISRRQLTERTLKNYVPSSILDMSLDLVYGAERNLQFDGSTTYSFVQTIFAPNAHSKARFGWSMSYDPVYGRVVIGSDASQSLGSGNAYVYSIVDGYYELETMLSPVQNADDDYGEEEDANFGVSVSIHGDYLGVGANRGHGELTRSGDVYIFRALTKNEYYGHSTSTGQIATTSEVAGAGFLLAVCGCLLIAFSLVWCRYKQKGDNEGFCTYISDSVSDTFSSYSSKSSHTSLQFLDEEDSQHSSHPMMNEASNKMKSSSNDRLSVSEGGGSSSLRSTGKYSTGNQNSYPAKSSKSRVQLAGMGASNAKRQGYANVNDL